MAMYSKSIITAEMASVSDEILHTTYLNMAACHIALGQFDKAIDKSCKSLEIRENHKAYYRRAVGYLNTGDLDRAKADLDTANALSPNDPAVLREYANYNNKLKQANQKQKKAFGGMFDKLSLEEDKE